MNMMTDQRRWVWLGVALVVAVLLYSLHNILSPFLVGILLAYLADPLVDRLERAGFVPLDFMAVSLQSLPGQDAFGLTWNSQAGRTYQVEYSPDLNSWFASPTGELIATGTTASWTDSGPPATLITPLSAPKRFYRVFQFGSP